MKIVYFGSDVFLSCFEYFLENHEILALYTYRNDEDYFTEYSIVLKAKSLGIPVYYDSITPERIKEYFENEGCELLFVAEYNRIIPIPEDLESFKGMNTHSSLLPQGRSYYPIESAMERGLKKAGFLSTSLQKSWIKATLFRSAGSISGPRPTASTSILNAPKTL